MPILNFTQATPSVDRGLFAIRLADLGAGVDFWDALANALGGASAKPGQSSQVGFEKDGQLSREEIKCLFDSARAYSSYEQWFGALSKNVLTKDIPLSTVAGRTLKVADFPKISNSAKAFFKSAFDGVQTLQQLELFHQVNQQISPFALIDPIDATGWHERSNKISRDEILKILNTDHSGLYKLQILIDASFM